MKFEQRHIKALLGNPETRKAILERLDEALADSDDESFSSEGFDRICEAAEEMLGEGDAPIAKEYITQGGYGEYSIEIVGVHGAYMVRALEHDDAGIFGTLEEAESYVATNWLGDAEER